MARSSRVELRRARRAGAKDGKAGIPNLEQDTLPFELQAIAARHDAEIAGIVGTWCDRDREVQHDAGQVREELAAVNERAALLTIRRDRLLADHERRTAQDDETIARLQAELEVFPTLDTHEDEGAPLPQAHTASTIDRELLEISGGSGGETSRRGFGRVVYWSLIFVIVVGEIPLNAFAFRLFREADLFTYVMTVTIAVALVACAHGAGVLLTHERSRTERAILAGTLLLPLAVIAVIAVVRDEYLRELAGDTGLAPLLGSLAFGLINLVIFGAAATFSYLHHDPRTRHNRNAVRREAERELTKAEERREHKERDRAKRLQLVKDEAFKREDERQAKSVRLRREQVVEAMRPIGERRRERETAVASIVAEVEQALASRIALEHRVAALERECTALRERAEATVHEAKRRRETVMLAYCAMNVRARLDHATPTCLRTLPEAQLPDGLPGVEREAVLR